MVCIRQWVYFVSFIYRKPTWVGRLQLPGSLPSHYDWSIVPAVLSQGLEVVSDVSAKHFLIIHASHLFIYKDTSMQRTFSPVILKAGFYNE
jgi:hypothetical protein